MPLNAFGTSDPAYSARLGTALCLSAFALLTSPFQGRGASLHPRVITVPHINSPRRSRGFVSHLPIHTIPNHIPPESTGKAPYGRFGGKKNSAGLSLDPRLG